MQIGCAAVVWERYLVHSIIGTMYNGRDRTNRNSKVQYVPSATAVLARRTLTKKETSALAPILIVCFL